MAEARSCGNCGTVAEPDDTFCGECGHSLDEVRTPSSQPAAPETAAPSFREEIPATRRDRKGVAERGAPKRFDNVWGITCCALFACTVLIMILAWRRTSTGLEDAVSGGLAALLLLIPISTLALSYLRPIHPGTAAGLLAVIYVIPVAFLDPNVVGYSLEEARPVFLFAGIVNIGLSFLVCGVRRRRQGRRA